MLPCASGRAMSPGPARRKAQGPTPAFGPNTLVEAIFKEIVQA